MHSEKAQTPPRTSIYIKWLIQCLETHTKPLAAPEPIGSLLENTTGESGQVVEVRETATRSFADAKTSLPALGRAAADSDAANPAVLVPSAEQATILTNWATELAITDWNGAAPADSPLNTARAAQVRVVTADRGRGKSAMLGILCAQAFIAGKSCIITAPSRRSAGILMHHLNAHLQTIEARSQGPTPVFLPPDELLASPVDAEIVLIDEAAALPLPMLQRLIETYNSLILATTIHGYEGAGRGFAIRLREWMKLRNIAYSWTTLQTPIRWLPGDRLESFCNHAFLLDAEYAPIDTHSARSANCLVEYYSREQLLVDSKLLRQCFALLVQAHYQTKPMDLRHMLDGQNIRVYVLRQGATIVGTALVAMEGFSPNASGNGLGQAIVEKRRRPRGHLLPQLLAQWTIDERALRLNIARIVRIAIHPQQQNRGLGTYFLGKLEKQLSHAYPLDAFGAVFGNDKRVMNFWERAGYRQFHVGRRKNNRSGARSAALVKAAEQSCGNARNALDIINRAWQLHAINFAHGQNKLAASVDTIGEIVGAYINLNRSFDDSRRFIDQFLRAKLPADGSQPKVLSEVENRLVHAATREDFQFKLYATQHGYAGKKAAEIAFKQALEKLYK